MASRPRLKYFFAPLGNRVVPITEGNSVLQIGTAFVESGLESAVGMNQGLPSRALPNF
ncbi:hypothetical protein DESC_740242 [Desulfosarcina cetonica]|nr:hypothetical protein DESC_740242 [Desulfosarcina cetonica]